MNCASNADHQYSPHHVYLQSALCANWDVTLHTHAHTNVEAECMYSHTHAYICTQPSAILPAQFHPTDIGIFRKSKPIDNLLQNYKRSIANFFALITTWTFNMHPVATV